jgi:hypothetical protein
MFHISRCDQSDCLSPSGEVKNDYVNAAMWQYSTLENYDFYSSNLLTITDFMQTCIPNCQFENIFSPYFYT